MGARDGFVGYGPPSGMLCLLTLGWSSPNEIPLSEILTRSHNPNYDDHPSMNISYSGGCKPAQSPQADDKRGSQPEDAGFVPVDTLFVGSLTVFGPRIGEHEP